MADKDKPREDPEEVAAREAGEQTPVIEEPVEEQDGEEVDSAVHDPHIVTAEEVNKNSKE